MRRIVAGFAKVSPSGSNLKTGVKALKLEGAAVVVDVTLMVVPAANAPGGIVSVAPSSVMDPPVASMAADMTAPVPDGELWLELQAPRASRTQTVRLRDMVGSLGAMNRRADGGNYSADRDDVREVDAVTQDELETFVNAKAGMTGGAGSPRRSARFAR